MTPLYNAGIGLYKLAAKAASVRSAKAKEMLEGQRRALAAVAAARERVAPDGFDVWFHAASLGEFEQGRPLIDRLRRERPELKMLLTFFSPSGYKVRCNYPNVDCVAYLPFDTPRMAEAFVEAASPRMAVFVKYEFWGNYLEALGRRDVPTYIISAIFRPSQPFFKRWGGTFRNMLGRFSRLYVQDEGSRRLLADIGVGNVTVAGDTRFDRVTDIRRAAREVPEIAAFVKDSPLTVVAGSTWPPDEDILLPWLNEHPDAKAIIAPHEFNEARLAAIEGKLRNGAVRLSALQKGDADADAAQAVIVDCFGLLSSLYRYGHLAYVGGGFGAGIHNINEAAVYGIPVVFGPRHDKFKEAADLIAVGGAFDISSAVDGHAILNRLAADYHFRQTAGGAAADYIARNIGASDRIYDDIFADF